MTVNISEYSNRAQLCPEKQEGITRVAVCIPNEGHTQVEAYANRLENFLNLGALQERSQLLNHDPKFEFLFLTLGRIFTPLAREEASEFALEWNCDYLYMIDDDMICPNDLFQNLHKHDVDVVAALAFTRNFPHKAVLYETKEGFDPVTRTPYFINHYVDVYKKDALVECDAVGFGAVLIKSEVLRGVGKPRFMSTTGTGEDVYFCIQAKKAGFRVFMDTASKIGHLSHPVVVTETYVEDIRNRLKYQENNPMGTQYAGNGHHPKVMPGVLVGD